MRSKLAARYLQGKEGGMKTFDIEFSGNQTCEEQIQASTIIGRTFVCKVGATRTFW
jgi:hypothetical protein